MLRPIRDWVAVTPDRAEKISKGGIIIPDNADVTKKTPQNATPFTGVVTGVGPGILVDGTLQPMACKVGDHVTYLLSKTVRLTLKGGEEVFVMREGDVLGVIED